MFALILLPLAGVAFAFPFSDADVDGTVNYRSTETLYFNEFWYEYEYIKENNDDHQTTFAPFRLENQHRSGPQKAGCFSGSLHNR